jgi:hypothetical protein
MFSPLSWQLSSRGKNHPTQPESYSFPLLEEQESGNLDLLEQRNKARPLELVRDSDSEYGNEG